MGVRIATAGQNSPLAVVVDARDGTVFAKGLPSGHRRVIAQAREAAVAPLVSAISRAWPTLGAGWTDPACWVLRLMASGHTPHEAERQASRLPGFRAADPAHIDLFAAANVRLWAEVAQSSASTWTGEMAQAARSWAAYRRDR
jgi:hypothetical protein